MFTRSLTLPDTSFFLFGPRGTGKSTWIHDRLPGEPLFDLLESDTYLELLASPARIEQRIPPGQRGWVVIDEIQKIPQLLDEVHRLIERKRLRFALTGSSARKLRSKGVNLLAGRALTLGMYPLTAVEMGPAFDLRRSLEIGHLPSAQTAPDLASARKYLSSYVQTYLREEVQQEGLARNLASFSRFLEAASFSQASHLNVSAVARECHVDRKVVEDYFGILDDLLIAVRIPAFSRRAKRKIVTHPKFFFFDVGVFRTIRPRGPLDSPAEIDGPALETLLLQELRAHNDYKQFGYSIHYWRTHSQLEVDFVLYGERGLKAFEVKRSSRVREEDLTSLRVFIEDYPPAEARLLYGGSRRYREGAIEIIPFGEGIRDLLSWL
jgi:predicted AAA+ superfamily ATPase